IARKRIADPRSGGVLTDGGRIVDGITNLLSGRVKKVEVAVQHLRAGYVANKSLGRNLMMAGKAKQPERSVFSVVELWDIDRPARHGRDFVVRLGRRQNRIEVIAMQQGVVQVSIF